MAYNNANEVTADWPQAERKFVELDRNGEYELQGNRKKTAKNYTATSTIDATKRYHRAAVGAGAVTLSFGATAALQLAYVGREYTFFTDDGGANALTISAPTGSYIYGAGNVAPQASIATTTAGTPSSCTVFVYSLTHIQVTAAVNMA